MKIALLAIIIFALSACTCNSRAYETLVKSGYSDIELTGWSPLSCDSKDLTSTGFNAVNANGRTVDGVVCCGILKRCTVRF